LREVIEQVEAVSSEEIRGLARDLFQPHQISLTLLGPVEDQDNLENLIHQTLKPTAA
jgi:predicted Zn-dependent peptidase